MQLFDPYQERLRGRNLLASDDVTVPAGGRGTTTITGRNGGEYGVLALSIDTTVPGQVVSVSTMERDYTYLSQVHASSIGLLFERRSYDLAAPILVRAGEALEVGFQNPTAQESSNSVLVQGLPEDLLRQRLESIRQGVGEIPDVQFGYVSVGEVAAGGSRSFQYELPKGQWATDHVQIVAPGNEESVSVTVESKDRVLIDKVRVADLQRYSEHRLSLSSSVPIGGSETLRLIVENGAAGAAAVSSVVPLYERIPTISRALQP